MSTLETISEKPSVDVTFTEQSLHVQLTLHTAGTVWLDCVEPQSAAHGRVNVDTSLVAVNGARMGKLLAGRPGLPSVSVSEICNDR